MCRETKESLTRRKLAALKWCHRLKNETIKKRSPFCEEVGRHKKKKVSPPNPPIEILLTQEGSRKGFRMEKGASQIRKEVDIAGRMELYLQYAILRNKSNKLLKNNKTTKSKR